MNLYGFIQDEVVFDPTIRKNDLANLILNCGFIDRQLVENFVNPSEFKDFRASRLPITYRASTYDNDPTVEANAYKSVQIVSQGQNSLIQYPDQTLSYGQYDTSNNATYASETLPPSATAITDNKMKLLLETEKLTSGELATLDSLTDTDFEYIFNIIEYLIYGTIPADTISDIETVLTGNAEYTNYIPTSVNLSPLRTAVELFDGLNIHRFAPRWIEFDYDKSGTTLHFKLWYDRNDFRQLYPLTTIDEVIPPIDVATLLDSSSLVDPLTALKNSSSLISDKLAVRLTNDNCSGYSGFTTRYVFGAKESLVTFGLTFRGRHPTLFETRNAIITYLNNSGLGDESIWRVRFPSLFVNNTFYMIPIWDNSTVMIQEDIYPSIISNKDEDTLMTNLMTGHVTDPQLYENITVAYDKFFIAVLPDDSNIETSIKAIHPTYRDFSSTEPGFADMQQSTQNFSILLNQVLAIAAGELNNTAYAEIPVGNLVFVSMIVDDSEYLVLKKDSYLANI